MEFKNKVLLVARLQHRNLVRLHLVRNLRESIQSGLVALAELYNSVEEFTQKSAADAKSMEKSLSQSVDLLDACSAIREALQMMRDNVHALQSAMRRKGTDAAYFSFRKRMQKTVAKTLRNLKKSESAIIKSGSNQQSVNAEGDFGFVFRQIAGITIANFRSVLVFLSCAAAQPGGWSLVLKLVAAKSGKEGVNEVENLDLAMQGKMCRRDCKMLMKLLRNLVRLHSQGVQERLVSAMKGMRGFLCMNSLRIQA